MKKIIIALILLLPAYILTGCIDRDVIDAKDGISLPPVTELKSSIQDAKEITLQWNIPANIPVEIKRPMSVYVEVYRENILEYYDILEDEPSTWNYTLPKPESKYRVVVKMLGWLKEKEYGKSDEIYSLGQTVSVN